MADENNAGINGNLSILSFNRRILETLLEEARQAYQDAEKKAISVWTADTYVVALAYSSKGLTQ